MLAKNSSVIIVTSQKASPKGPRAHGPKSQRAQEPKKGPRAQDPNGLRAQLPKSPTAQEPNGPRAQRPKSPTAQEPKGPRKTQDPKKGPIKVQKPKDKAHGPAQEPKGRPKSIRAGPRAQVTKVTTLGDMIGWVR
jgi:hypothetical protein